MKIEIDTDNLTEEQKRVLGLLKEDSRTPAQKAGWEIGYYGIITLDNCFAENSIVRFYQDDKSYSPVFELVAGEVFSSFTEFGHECAYVNLHEVKLIGKGVGRYE